MIRRLLLILLTVLPMALAAQNETPVEYLTRVTMHEEEISKDYWRYISAVNHGRGARKLEKRREELLRTVQEARNSTARMKGWEKEVALRDAVAEYYRILFLVLKEDYGKIVNLEEIAEQSYDNMEAYLMAQERAGETLDSASSKRNTAYQEFADHHNVRLVHTDTKLGKKLDQSSRVTKYYNQVFLIFFKSNKQEYYVIDAMNSGNVNATEQNRTALINYAAEGLAKLAGINPFENDNTIVDACRKLLTFYKQEGDQKIPKLTEFNILKAEFEKTKKAFDAIPQSERLNSDLDHYNKMVNDLNKASRDYNQTNQTLNTTRTALLNDWHAVAAKFLDSHTPLR